MEEILNSEQFKDLMPYVPFIALAGVIRFTFVILLAISARSTLLMIKKENRCLLPGQVWLLLLPFFNIYWNYVVARRVSDSLNNEFYDRKIAVEENPALRNGYWFAGSFLIFNFPLPLFVTFVIWILALIALILYWVKINEYNKILRTGFVPFSEENDEDAS